MENNDDVFKKFIGQETNKFSGYPGTPSTPGNYAAPPTNVDNIREEMVYGREYLSIDLNTLPAGMFYKPGTKISIRAASVSDVQEYSVVDNTNIVDVTEKMNLILSRCVRFVNSNGLPGNYRNIKDNDRLFLIFMIRELTFQKGNNLAKEVTCDTCGHEFKIEFRATNSQEVKKTFVNHDIDQELLDYFNPVTRTIDLEIDDKTWKLTPPTIGLQEIFFEDLKNKFQLDTKKTPNVAFLKIIPFTLWDRDSISEDGIKEKEKQFKELDMDTFQILNHMVKKMENIGIKELKTNCPVCDGEVHTDMSFPGGASSIFVVSDPLTKLKKK